MPCATCQHVRAIEGESDVLECHAYPPEKGAPRASGRDSEWPRVGPNQDCGLWLHRLTDDIKPTPKPE